MSKVTHAIGGAVSAVAKVVTAPVVAPVKAAVSIAKGENVLSSVSKATVQVAQSTVGGPGFLAGAAASGAGVSSALNYVPLVGGTLSSYADSSGKIASGDFRAGDVLSNFKDSAILGAAAYGGAAAVGTFGAGATLTGATALSRASRGDLGGLASAAGDFAGGLVPDGLKDTVGGIVDAGKGVAGMVPKGSGPGAAAEAGGSRIPATTNTVPVLQAEKSGSGSALLPAAIVGGAVALALIMKRR